MEKSTEMKKLHLIMPMGGAGSRFFKDGYVMPKPLIEIEGKPFLYWATQSICRFIDVKDLTFVVLQDHIDNFSIDSIIKKHFPNSNIVVIPGILPGPVMTCLEGLSVIHDNDPILFNDCDHMFKCSGFNKLMNSYPEGLEFDGGLITFKSDKPQFSYIKYDGNRIVGTVEKQVVSDDAICGAYIFRNSEIFRQMSEKYLKVCEYSEYFVSGIYNVMCSEGKIVKNFPVDFHVPFGTPEEYEATKGNEHFIELMGDR